jgi:putative hydrolase of HD superfamily
LPEDQAKELYDLWEEFEAYETPEAIYAHTMDNFQPLMLNNATHGRSWKEHGVKLSQMLKRNKKTGLGSEAVWNYAYNIIEENMRNGNIIRDVEE